MKQVHKAVAEQSSDEQQHRTQRHFGAHQRRAQLAGAAVSDAPLPPEPRVKCKSARETSQAGSGPNSAAVVTDVSKANTRTRASRLTSLRAWNIGWPKRASNPTPKYARENAYVSA